MKRRKDPSSVGAERGGGLNYESRLAGPDVEKLPYALRPVNTKNGVVSIHDGKGFETYREPVKVIPAPQGGKRGKVKGWSSASRRRMRQYMLNHRPVYPDVYGATLTIPGPVLPAEQAKKIFHEFCWRWEKLTGCAIWRIELQRRKQAHWHMVVSLPPWNGETKIETYRGPIWCTQGYYEGRGHREWVELKLRDCWAAACDSLGVFARLEWVTAKGRTKTANDCKLSEIPGFWLYAVDVQSQGNAGAWMRYLQDHASKTKQEQIAENIGRHWGVIGRKYFKRVEPDEVVELTERQFAKFIRAQQRLATGTCRAKCVFGRKLMKRSMRGSGQGAAVWFGSTETCRRLLMWAKSF